MYMEIWPRFAATLITETVPEFVISSQNGENKILESFLVQNNNSTLFLPTIY